MGPDAVVLWRWRGQELTATVAFTWVLMAVLVATSWWVTRRFAERDRAPSRPRLFLELVVSQMRRQIREASREDPEPYLAFVGTIFLFVAGASLLGVIPGYVPPTASLSTTAALAACVFLAVPVFGIARRGPMEYLRDYLRPTPFMLPFHLVGELSRTLALAVRLFGNILSGQLMAAILVTLIPFFFPAVLQAFGLLIGMIQAYVFAVLALVYIVSAVRSHRPLSPGDAEESGTPPRAPVP